jgi:hypothetical protein
LKLNQLYGRGQGYSCIRVVYEVFPVPGKAVEIFAASITHLTPVFRSGFSSCGSIHVS